MFTRLFIVLQASTHAVTVTSKYIVQSYTAITSSIVYTIVFQSRCDQVQFHLCLFITARIRKIHGAIYEDAYESMEVQDRWISLSAPLVTHAVNEVPCPTLSNVVTFIDRKR